MSRAIVKPPAAFEMGAAAEASEVKTGALTHGEVASWMGNAIVLASIGTIALFVAPRSAGVDAVSSMLIIIGIALAIWASYKFFFLNSGHHYTEWILLVIVIACIAAFVWLVVLVN
jgi:hypothetical protein